MTTATVAVLHAILTPSGWVQAGQTVQMDEEEARQHEARGYVDILSVDGKPEVWQACCTDH